MSKAVYNSHGWIVTSYIRSDEDRNWRVQVIRGNDSREIRTYDSKPPVVGQMISIHRE